MTGVIKGAIIGVVALIPTAALFFLSGVGVSNASNAEVVEVLAQEDISQVTEVSTAELAQAEDLVTTVFLIDEFTPIKAIHQRDTLSTMSFAEVLNITGLNQEQVLSSLATGDVIEGYLFEYDTDEVHIHILMPPDTTVYPNMEGTVALTGLPKELIILSLTEQKTVEGTKFEYEK